MPESVTDRPTKAHSTVFLLAKNSRYYFDQEAVREAYLDGDPRPPLQHRDGERWPNSGRNIRSVWTIPTQPFPEAHFATFPEELVRRCLLAGCPEQVCRECGKARERIVEFELVPTKKAAKTFVVDARDEIADGNDQGSNRQKDGHKPGYIKQSTTLGFTDCGHDAYRPGIVLDPFIGSGTVGLVARKHNRRAIGIDLNRDYCAMAARRLAQQSLFAEIR